MINYIYGALILVAIVLIYFAAKQYQKTKDLLHDGIRTTATVINMITVSSNDGNTYKPIFEYRDRANNVKTFQAEVSSNPPAYKIGDKQRIIYSPEESDLVKTVSYWGLYRWTIILLSIAMPLLIIGGGYFLYLNG